MRISALTLLVPGVVADDHDIAVATNHLAFLTDLLNARFNLHNFPLRSGNIHRQYCFTCIGRRFDRATNRRD